MANGKHTKAKRTKARPGRAAHAIPERCIRFARSNPEQTEKMRAHYQGPVSQQMQPKRPEPISVLGVIVEYQGEVKINTRGENIPKGQFEMYNTRYTNDRVYGDVSEMGEVIVALTSHCVSVYIW